MRIRIHRHIVDLAGSGLVLIGFLLAAMAISAAPTVIGGLTRHDVAQAPAAGGGLPPLNSPGGAT